MDRTRITDASGSSTCEKVGTIDGLERRCPADMIGLCSLQLGCGGTVECNTLTGKYRADGSDNYVEFFIERKGAERETYVGGWSGSNLIVRSERTGRQLVIAHEFNDVCF